MGGNEEIIGRPVSKVWLAMVTPGHLDSSSGRCQQSSQLLEQEHGFIAAAALGIWCLLRPFLGAIPSSIFSSLAGPTLLEEYAINLHDLVRC